jgi:multiple antibiotic resistance protein
LSNIPIRGAIMEHSLNFFVNIWIKLFFLLTPFFTLSMFLSLTQDNTNSERFKISIRVTFSIIIISFFLFFFGNQIFEIFGITLDSFRIGAGSLLFLSAVDMVRVKDIKTEHNIESGDIAVVPLAIPITVGPATIGTLLVMGAEMDSRYSKIIGVSALFLAILCVGIILLLSSPIQSILGRKGFTILSKITGLILSALAAQMIFTGVRNFLL